MKEHAPDQNRAHSHPRLKKPLRSILAYSSAGLTYLIILFVMAHASLFTSPLVCPALGTVCDDNNISTTIAILGAVAAGVVTGAFVLRLLAKRPWPESLIVPLLGMLGSYMVFSSILTVYQADAGGILLLLPVLVIAMFIIHGFLFIALSKHPWLKAAVILVLIVSYVAAPPLLQGWLKERRIGWEEQKDLNEAKTLPFTPLAPSYTPSTYRLVSINAILAYHNVPDNYSLTYSNRPKFHTAGSKSLYFGQETKLPGGESPCDKPNSFAIKEHLGECAQIGRIAACDVYRQFPSRDSKENAQAFCTINGTRITLTYLNSEIANDEVVKIFASLKPAHTEALQREAAQNNAAMK